MKTLIWYEFKKIICGKVNQITIMIGILFVIAANFISIPNSANRYSSDGKYLTGISRLKEEIAIESGVTKELKEDFLTDFIQDYQKRSATGFDFSLIASKVHLYILLADNYADFNEDWEWENLMKINTEKGIGFYDRRAAKINMLLNAE